jgi:hypothetical protein
VKLSLKFVAGHSSFEERHRPEVRAALRVAIAVEKAARKHEAQKFSPVRQHYPALHQ